MIRSLRTSSAIVALFAASGAMVSPGAAQPDGGADLILRGGTIYSGEAAPFRGDVAIRGDRITYVGPKAPGTAERTARKSVEQGKSVSVRVELGGRRIRKKKNKKKTK